MTWYSLADQGAGTRRCGKTAAGWTRRGVMPWIAASELWGSARTLIEQWNNLPVLPNGPLAYAGVTSPPPEREVEWPAERTRAGSSHVTA